MATAYDAAGTRSVNFRFTGGALPMFGRALLAVLCSILIIPAAWGTVPYLRWLVENIELSDGERMSFEGRPGDVWYLFSAAALIGFIPSAFQFAFDNRFEMTVLGVLVSAVFSAFIAVRIWQWMMANTRVGGTSDLTFDGTYLPYLGFMVLTQLSGYTIIGWAWAYTAFQRWLMGHIQSREVRFEFTGSGLSFLWRGFVGVLACIAIIPIPWIMKWMTGWFIEQTVMHRTGASEPAANPYPTPYA